MMKWGRGLPTPLALACLSNPPLQSLRSRACASKQGRARSRPRPSTSQQVLAPFSLPSVPHPPPVFRDQLYKHLETVTPGDFDAVATKLVQAGSTLEYLKYAEPLFEIIFVGGLLQPGGSFIDDGAPPSPFSIFNAKDPADVDDIKKYIEVINKLTRRSVLLPSPLLLFPTEIRYKYLQKPLEEAALPGLLQYIHRWAPEQKDKLAIAIGLLISQGLANASCLQSLGKDHLIKNGSTFFILPLRSIDV